jgi:UDPglucose--hexose-1-phosphate uridylyltransferase
LIRDPLTGEHALLGTTRAGRPNEYRDGPEERCAFCPGNEDLTPPEIARIGTADRWEVRVFRNKFPAIVPPDGDHEVIVDARGHDDEITPLGLQMWRERYRAALARMPSSFPVLFKNSGEYAGATLVHPHTQLIVLPSRPDRWQHISSTGACALCAERTRAETDGTVVDRCDGAMAFVRGHSRFSWSLTILPDACVPSLDRADALAWDDAGTLTARAVRAVRSAFGARTGFNVLVYSDPHATSSTFHWHIEAVPRISTLAGFELSTGMFIRGAGAQESAERWRRMIAPLDGSL